MIRLILISILFSCSISAQTNVIKVHESTMVWDENRPLTWEDYQGKVDEKIIAHAATAYKIEIVPENVLVDEADRIQSYKNLTVVANFYKNESWTMSASTILLEHERLHVDIAEIFARKIRRRFRELQLLEEARFSVYFQEYSVLWKECMAFQKRFEKETENGRVEQMNKVWAKKVKEMLNELSDYKSNLVVRN